MKLLRNLNKWFQKNLLLNTKPSKLWKILRFFIHWLTLPLKLVLIGSLGLFQIIKYSFKKKRTPLIANVIPESKSLLELLPLMKHENYTVYLPRQKYGAEANGRNHNTDHQCSRQGTYVFLKSKAGLLDANDVAGLREFLLGDYLARGFSVHDIGLKLFNTNSVSGDMLCGMALAVSQVCESDEFKTGLLQESYEKLIASIIKNDYSLKEYNGPMPDDDGILPEIYKERLAEAKFDKFLVNMKSNRAMWQPGIETVGAQALTVLAALRVADVKFRSPQAREHYKKLLWKYGYGLLSIFPTAYIDSRRGYFNDHNCMMALYVLAKNAKYKWFWKLPMLYVWALSRHWNNMYFDGLLVDAYPELKGKLKKHIELSKAYLMEVSNPMEMVKRHSSVIETQTHDYPVPLTKVYDDEFYPDIRRDVICTPNNDSSFHYSGLGYYADLVMSELTD